MLRDKIKDFRDYLFPAEPSAGLGTALNASFDRIGFSDDYVSAAIQNYRYIKERKFVKDAIWGMVELEKSSVILLDSPVIQRLRRIRQLGFSYLTYPTAEHSRFVHSLGMYAVVKNFLDAMQDQPRTLIHSDFELHEVPRTRRSDFLHAALLHDIGHGPFSHVTEGILEGLAEPANVRIGTLPLSECIERFQELFATDAHLSEIFSIIIILSPRFSRFYAFAVLNQPEEEGEAPIRLAALVAGRPLEPDLPGYADLISSKAVDADKIDYIRRDSTAAGIPVGIDVARLFLRSSFLKIGPTLKSRLYAQDADPAPGKAVVVFAVNASGIDTLEELRAARATLYQRVYLHKTTRTAERLLAQAFQRLAEIHDQNNGDNDALDPIGLWTKDDWTLLHDLSRSADPQVQHLSLRLLNRSLLQRAAVFWVSAFRPCVPLEMLSGNRANIDEKELRRQTVRDSVEKLTHYCDDPNYVRNIEIMITDEMKSIQDELEKRDRKIPRLDLRKAPLLAVLPMLPLRTLKLGDTVVLDNNIVQHSSSLSIIDEQADAAEIYKSKGFVMADPDWRAVAMIATRNVLYKLSKSLGDGQLSLDKASTITIRKQSRLLLDVDSTIRQTGINSNDVTDRFRLLERAGYFDQTPRLARSYDDESEVVKIASKLHRFDGQHDWMVTAESVRSFLNQFPPRLREEAARLMRDELILIDRAVLKDNLISALARISSAQGSGAITALSPNSGNLVRMLLDQEARPQLDQLGWHCEPSLHAALAKASPGRTLVLCDDLVVSGSQASAQVRAWLGQPRNTWPTEQRYEQNIEDVKLTDDTQSKLKTQKIAIATCVGDAAAEGPISAAFQENNCDNYSGLCFGSTLEASGARSAKLSTSLRKFLEDVGTQLLEGVLSRREPQGDTRDPAEKLAWCRNNALGYGGRCHVIATLLNVPTSTITALWCPGVYSGEPWFPLLLRRGYLADLIVC